MADFRRQRKFKTKRPQLKVAAGLPVGTYTFQLVVEDQSGNRSRAAQVRIQIVDDNRPIRPLAGGDVRVTTPVISRGPTVRIP